MNLLTHVADSSTYYSPVGHSTMATTLLWLGAALPITTYSFDGRVTSGAAFVGDAGPFTGCAWRVLGSSSKALVTTIRCKTCCSQVLVVISTEYTWCVLYSFASLQVTNHKP